MQNFYLIVNWTVAVALLCLGAAALIKSVKLALNRVFAIFTLTVSVWIISAYISNDVANSMYVSIVGNYFVFLFSFISGFLLLWFAIALANDRKMLGLLRKIWLPLALVAMTTCTPLVVAGVERQGSVYAVKFGPLAVVYFLGLMTLLILAMYVLHKNIRLKSGHQKAHLKVVYRSMIVGLPILVITEFVLPALTGWFGLTNVGIIAMAIPVVALYYSTFKLRLFNLRLFVVRSLAYIFALAIIGFTYSLVSYNLASKVLNLQDPTLHELVNVMLLSISVIVYPPVFRVFRRWTDSLFYQDAYQPQELFDDLNQVLVSTLDLNKMLYMSGRTITGQIKIEYCTFVLRATQYSEQRFISTDQKRLDRKELAYLSKIIDSLPSGIVAVDALNDEEEKTRRLLETNNISILLQLVPNQSDADEGFGYMVLGNKKSGSPYSRNDVKVIETIAKELVLAMQNAYHFEEIQKFNSTLQERIEQATAELRRTNAKLVALDEAKDDFISMASHQLRTPLTAVKGYVSMVLEGDAGKVSPMQRKMLNQAFMSSQRMVYLISDLLNVSRLKSGKFVIERSKVDLANLIDQEIVQLQEVAAGRGLKLTFDKPKNFPPLMLDETKTRQVVMNFVDNAIHYTPSGGHVSVELGETKDSIELRVRDDGIGVPKTDQHHLFTKFYRAANARRERPDGTGLGLFMAKKVIIAQGGAVVFESRERKGSVFGFSMPKQRIIVSNSTPKPTATSAPVAVA